MSYDLFFGVDSGQVSISMEKFVDYFRNRRDYQTSEVQASYENEDTGTYFFFYFGKEGADESDQSTFQGTELTSCNVSLNVNYCRPHVFGLEAEPEVSAFIERFDLRIVDMQREGMGAGPYSREGFLRGWNAGNAFGCRAVAEAYRSRGETWQPFALPASEIERCWQWNHGRRRLQDQLGDDVFVPRISFFNEKGRVHSFAVWTDAIPIAMPTVDFVLLYRNKLAPHRFLRRAKPDFALIPFGSVGGLLTLGREVEHPTKHSLLRFNTAPKPLLDLFGTATPIKQKLEGIPVSDILDAELFQQ